MNASNRTIARTLLRGIPDDERAAVVRDVISALDGAGIAEFSLAVSLMAEHPDVNARPMFLDRLHGCVAEGRLAVVEGLCTHDLLLRRDLLDHVVRDLYWMAANLANGDGRVSMEGIVYEGPPRPESESQSAVPLLHFVKSAGDLDLQNGVLNDLLFICVTLLGSPQENICIAARQALQSIFLTASNKRAFGLTVIWKCVVRLITAKDRPFHNGIGYSIWLYSAAAPGARVKLWLDAQYWALLQEGLCDGDGERRKQCISILRLSVAIAANDDRSCQMICPPQNGPFEPNVIKEQYERYCTVFETVLLGRYLNQIVECEGDLDMLLQADAMVLPVWLYTLLSAAMGPKLQDSNRKFIGRYVMRQSFEAHAAPIFIDFFQRSFLPWAMQGPLFTASLKRRDGGAECTHGQELAEFVSDLLVSKVLDLPFSKTMVDVILDVLTARMNNSFVYASLYLLQGLATAIECNQHLALDLAQLRKVVKLCQWSGLPEVARDFVLVRCWKICADCSSRASGILGDSSINEAIRRSNTLFRELVNLRSSGTVGQPVSSLYAEESQRDIKEKMTLEKCRMLGSQLTADAASMRQSLDDIWEDTEYLEYPKRLLLVLPSLLLDPRILVKAKMDQDLASTVADVLRKLQHVCSTRVYLLTPLVSALRTAVMMAPECTNLWDLESIVITFADALPRPTIDLQFEDATASMLQAVSTSTETLDYAHYFGPRENLGTAALLDLTSRLGYSHHQTSVNLLNRILDLWVKQRTPPPSVCPWKTTLQLQILLLCSEQTMSFARVDESVRILTDLHYVLSIEPLPRYRYLLSWILGRIYLKHDHFCVRIPSELASKDHHFNPKYLASLMKIGVMVARALSTTNTSSAFTFKLMSTFVPLAASSKVVIRHESQWQIPVLMELARERSWSDIRSNAAFVALNEYIRSLERFDDPPLERLYDRFDLIKDHTMSNLVEGLWWELDHIEKPLCGRGDFVNLHEADANLSDAGTSRPKPCIPLGDPIAASGANSSGNISNDADTSNGLSLRPAPAQTSHALQTKGTAYLSAIIQDTIGTPQLRNNLIVVASLVDNPHNLGGLSRVSEIFGAAELHVQNPTVTSNRDFQNVSVSSHLHFPIRQLAASAIPEYLASKKSETAGSWTIVGIEQTDRSVILGSEACVLPDKCVLVLGSEREGIPATVLAECDMLVEIPQAGVTRSLNVQTAAGCVLYEWSRQHNQVV